MFFVCEIRVSSSDDQKERPIILADLDRISTHVFVVRAQQRIDYGVVERDRPGDGKLGDSVAAHEAGRTAGDPGHA